MNLTGYNPSVVAESLSALQNAYNDLATALTTTLQNRFVEGMADKWASPNAVTFFTGFQDTMNGVIIDADVIFSSVKGAMNSAAAQWAMSAGEGYSNIPFQENGNRINISSIQSEIGGVKGIDRDNASSTANSALSAVQTDVESALSRANSAVQECGFIGGNQASNLQASLNQIQTNVNNAFSEIKQALEKAINDTVQQYNDTEGKISQAFAGN